MSKPIALATLLSAVSALATGVDVDAAHERHSISPEVYGLVGGDPAQLSRMGVTVRRHGGNGLSRYNFELSSTNTGGDGHFFHKRASAPADDFVRQAKAAGAASLIELPMLGFVSNAMGEGQRCGFSVGRYGAQQGLDPEDPGCGDGVLPDGGLLLADPLDDSLPADETFSARWVAHLVATFGAGGDGGVAYYNLGNQPALWNQTHRDVHPQPASYAEITGKAATYARAVKLADPTAKTMGPGAWGWLEYFDSAANDRALTGVDFVPYYLRAAKGQEASSGRRMLDYLDVHIYPQATGIAAGASTPDANAMRIRSTRILWDPEYPVESWEACCYGGVLEILPRMHRWIDAEYPGTKLAVSAYGFGAVSTLNGALAQVIVLGALGQQRVDLAALDEVPAPGSWGEDAFQLFRNYDGQGARFGDTSFRARSQNPSRLQSYAAFDAQGRITVVVVNADPDFSDDATLTFGDMGAAGPYRAFAFGSVGHLAAFGSGQVSGGQLSLTVPKQTAVLVEFTPAGGIGPEMLEEPDAGTPDAGPAQTGDPDGGSSQNPPAPKSGCAVAGGALWLGALVAARLLRRRGAS